MGLAIILHIDGKQNWVLFTLWQNLTFYLRIFKFKFELIIFPKCKKKELLTELFRDVYFDMKQKSSKLYSKNA